MGDPLSNPTTSTKIETKRSVQWKVHLQVLPPQEPDAWNAILTKKRAEYEHLKNSLLKDPAAKEVGEETHHPLSLEDNSPWTQYFQNGELLKVIRQDVERTMPDQITFRSKAIQEMMTSVLFVWSKLHPTLSYRQGMHELLAPIIYTVEFDKVLVSSKEVDGSASLCDSRFVEHDSYTLFDQLMNNAQKWFELGDESHKETNTKLKKAIFQNSLSKTNQLPIVSLCLHIQNEVIQKLDPDLYKTLKDLNIEPQLYGLRWIRLLFGREFPFEQVLSLWDALFAEDSNLGLVEWICVAMLRLLRNHCIGSDYVGVLQVLMKYPALESLGVDGIDGLVKMAKSCILEYHEILRNPKAHLSPTTTSNKAKHGTSTSSSTESISDADKLVSLEQRVRRLSEKSLSLKDRDKALALKLDHCISLLSDIMSDFDNISDRRNELDGVIDQLGVVKSELDFSGGSSMSMVDGGKQNEKLPSHLRASDELDRAKSAAAFLHESTDVPEFHRIQRDPSKRGNSSTQATNPLDSLIASISTAAQEVDLSKTVKGVSNLFAGMFEDNSLSSLNPFATIQSPAQVTSSAQSPRENPADHWTRKLKHKDESK
ncbi:RabGAP/TBC [Rhizoclosmatium globosum]|uniref:RabGAP/TBC n=1 Tax=Rhizoclosmatium globosum TaxID=329046 RepID=A0A1Y2CWE0_9FUNG|nr:RabGAP/TBC [Rhizoclosmatium globosum]|eukprot:ORY51340.1 RabGAP/TBC [Rhizoclosmatium globosum]